MLQGSHQNSYVRHAHLPRCSLHSVHSLDWLDLFLPFAPNASMHLVGRQIFLWRPGWYPRFHPPPLLDLFVHPTSPQLSPLLFSTGLRVLSKVMLLEPFGLSTLFSVGLGCCPSNDLEVWLWWFRFALNTPWLCCFVCTVSTARRSSGRLLSPP